LAGNNYITTMKINTKVASLLLALSSHHDVFASATRSESLEQSSEERELRKPKPIFDGGTTKPPKPTRPPICDDVCTSSPTPPPQTRSPFPPTTPRPTLNCPSVDNLIFIHPTDGTTEGCDNISFWLENPEFPSASYSYSIFGVGNNIPGHLNISLEAIQDTKNYVFWAYADVPGCPTVERSCLINCYPGGPPSANDPPYCAIGRNRRQRTLLRGPDDSTN
jgi:hypothetical protein